MRDAAIERELLSQLQAAWRHANAVWLGGALRAPAIGLCDDRRRLGRWTPRRRLIELDRELVHSAPWEQVLEVLRHEMAHQYAHEVLGAAHEAAHGPAFQHAAQRLGVDRVAAGLDRRAPADDRVLRRVRKLLCLATSPNPHEAEAAMARAQRLMLEHNIAATGETTYEARIIGPRKLRFQRWEHLLVALLTEHFFVQAIWVRLYLRDRGREGRAVEFLGTPANLDMAAYVHGFLTRAGDRLFRSWARTHPPRRSDRGRFMSGLMLGFSRKLRDERAAHLEAGLVWVGDPGLDTWFGRRHPRVRSGRRTWIPGGQATAAGRDAGGRVVLHRPITARSGGSPKRLVRRD